MTTKPDEPVADDFADTFAQIAKDDAKAAAPAAEVTDEKPAAETPAAEAKPAVEGGGEGDKKVEPAAADAGGEPAKVEAEKIPDAEVKPEVKPPADADDDLLKRLASLVKKAPDKPEPETKPAVKPAASDDVSVYSKEDQELLNTYEKDWPEVAKAESVRRRGEYQQLVGYVFAEVAKEFKPIIDTVRELASRTQLAELESRVEGYATIDRDKVTEWVGAQPSYLQNAYTRVIEQGTAEEVSDLLARYKQDTAPAKPAAAARKPDTELPTATKQAAASLAPVSSKRSAVSQAADPNDFEAAFATFADKL